MKVCLFKGYMRKLISEEIEKVLDRFDNDDDIDESELFNLAEVAIIDRLRHIEKVEVRG